MNRYPSVRLLRLILTVLIAGLICAGCHRGKTAAMGPAATERPPKERVEAEFKNARIIWHDEQGRTLWEAKFDKAVASQEGVAAEVKLLGVKASLYTRGKVASTLTAPEVMADSRTKEIRASGGVKIVSATEQSSASADRLVWKADEDRLIGEGGVRMSKDGIQARARSLTADTALAKTTLSGDAEMSLSE